MSNHFYLVAIGSCSTAQLSLRDFRSNLVQGPKLQIKPAKPVLLLQRSVERAAVATLSSVPPWLKVGIGPSIVVNCTANIELTRQYSNLRLSDASANASLLASE